MPNRLPQGAEGAAALSMIFAYVSCICSALLIWLTWVHNERLSYVACIAYFALASTTASIIQQIHDISFWKDVMIEQFENRLAHPDSPDINIANGSVGVDLVLFYIQFYTYNVMSMFVMFWASELAQSIYGLTEKSTARKILRKVNVAGKVIAVALPLTTVLALRAPVMQSSTDAFTLLAGVPLMISLGCGSLLMLAILFRYIQSRRKLLSFDPGNGQSADPENSKSGSRTTRSSRLPRSRGIFDRWLMTRFTVAFVLLGVFQLTIMIFSRFSKGNIQADVQAATPDVSTERARQTMYLFMPGNTPGIALFIVFGTTTTFRQHMYYTFVPERWQHRHSILLLEEPSQARASVPPRELDVMKSFPASVDTSVVSERMAEEAMSISNGRPGYPPAVLEPAVVVGKPVHARGNPSYDDAVDTIGHIRIERPPERWHR